MATMESFIQSYGLPFPAFRELLTETNSLVAGSSALALYLQQEGIDPGFVPGDLDIWVEHTRELLSSNGLKHIPANIDRFSLFLIQQGYNLTTKFEPNEADYERLHHVAHILSFVKQDKEIQVIMVNLPNLLTYIQCYFDLSICVSWWNATENTFHTMNPDATRRKDMYAHPQLELGEREHARIQKYNARGFYLAEIPCMARYIQDMRPSVDVLQNTSAFDVIAYEEVNAAAFLRQSSFHILIQMGEQLHAFHRSTLYNYLMEHQTELSIGHIVDTPHKLSIMSTFLQVLPYSDYSVYRLEQAYSTQGKNIYRVHCYTLDGWFTDEPEETIDPPLACQEPEIQRVPLYHESVYWMD